MTDGMPASSSMAGRTRLASRRGASSARNTAVSRPMGTPITIAPNIPAKEARIMCQMPYLPDPGLHSVPEQEIPQPDFPMAGAPSVIM